MLLHNKIGTKIISNFFALLVIIGLGACGNSDGSKETDISNSENEVSATETDSKKDNKKDSKKDDYAVIKKARQISLEVPGSVNTNCVNDGMIGFRYGQGLGYMDENGKVVIDSTVYKSSDGFSENLAIVNDSNNAFYIIDKMGNKTPIQIPANKDSKIEFLYGSHGELSRFSDGVAILRGPGVYYFIQTDGSVARELTTKAYCVDYDFKSACAAFVERDETNGQKKVLLYNKLGEEIPLEEEAFSTDVNYDNDFSDGLLIVKNASGLMGAVNKDGKTVIPFAYEKLKDSQDGRIPFLKYGKWGFIDYNNNIVIEPTYVATSKFTCGIAKVKSEDNNTVFINTDNEVVIPNANDFNASVLDEGTNPFHDNGIAVRMGGDIINTKGEVIPGVKLSAGERYLIVSGMLFINPSEKTGECYDFS